MHDCHNPHCPCCLERRLQALEAQLASQHADIAVLQRDMAALLEAARRPVGIDARHSTPEGS